MNEKHLLIIRNSDLAMESLDSVAEGEGGALSVTLGPVPKRRSWCCPLQLGIPRGKMLNRNWLKLDAIHITAYYQHFFPQYLTKIDPFITQNDENPVQVCLGTEIRDLTEELDQEMTFIFLKSWNAFFVKMYLQCSVDYIDTNLWNPVFIWYFIF